MGPPAGHRNHAVFVVALIASGRNAVAAATACGAPNQRIVLRQPDPCRPIRSLESYPTLRLDFSGLASPNQPFLTSGSRPVPVVNERAPSNGTKQPFV
jgi:hypothetical protein